MPYDYMGRSLHLSTFLKLAYTEVYILRYMYIHNVEIANYEIGGGGGGGGGGTCTTLYRKVWPELYWG